ncbi:hypothetical protein E1B28_006771 [Marasmius oreades]|uniref:Uncharacterized protein n=1 Tax=Marasmius oreades TaxID=181124 RepID=A0A9P7UWW6_9AGAR|nr:uncharacterized protein E1B28_006771 [Marasmius oreades]KAG7096095.1 hypothetical protein E1B28_006771 [Marasmius oreades]
MFYDMHLKPFIQMWDPSPLKPGEHVRTKRLYGRTNKNHNYVRQIAAHSRHQRMLYQMRIHTNFEGHCKGKRAGVYRVPDKERLPPGNPKDQYSIAQGEQFYLALDPFRQLYQDDPANFYDQLHAHLFARILKTDNSEDFNVEDLSSICFVKDKIYTHKCFRLHYNTYNMHRKSHTISTQLHPNVMLLADDATAEEQEHPYRYARVIGVFHVNVAYWRQDMAYGDSVLHRMDFLWVQWYELDTSSAHGWQAKRFPKVHFLPSSEYNAFSFVDPSTVLQGAYMQPFAGRLTSDLVTPTSTARFYKGVVNGKYELEMKDWRQYQVNEFPDCDMFMQYHGGGVGHSTHNFTRGLEVEATFKDPPLPVYDRNTGIVMVRSLSPIDEVPEEIEEEEEEGDDNSELWSQTESDSSEELSDDGYTSQDDDLDELEDL